MASISVLLIAINYKRTYVGWHPVQVKWTFSRSGATFTLSYQLSGRKVINEGNLLKRHDNLSVSATYLLFVVYLATLFQ
jgi:hypothetical protein